MPTIAPPVLDSAIYLYPSREAADSGQRAGGSGFLAVVELEDHPAGTFYAVTNAHVVAGGAMTVRLNTQDGRHDSVEIPDSRRIRHPEGDDVVIAEITLSANFRYSAVPTTSFLDGFDLSMFAVGQEVYMVGRFVNHEGAQRNLPTVRFGHVAQLPHERIRTHQGIEREAFLADMRSLSGYSGSPVFVYRNRPDLDENPETWIRYDVRTVRLRNDPFSLGVPALEVFSCFRGELVRQVRKDDFDLDPPVVVLP